MRRPRGRPSDDEPLHLTEAEAEALTRMFRAELDRGWIPTAGDLRAGLAILRERAEVDDPGGATP